MRGGKQTTPLRVWGVVVARGRMWKGGCEGWFDEGSIGLSHIRANHKYCSEPPHLTEEEIR